MADLDRPDLHGLTGAYAVDALDADERAAFERHLSECPDCAEEVAAFEAVGAELAAGVGQDPPPALRARVLDQVAATPQDAAPAGLDGRRGPGRAEASRPWWRQPFTVAAAALVLVAGLGVAIVQLRDQAEDAPAAQLAAVLAAPDAEIVELDAPQGATARFAYAESVGDGVLVTQGLDAPPTAHAYAIWMLDEEDPALAGHLSMDEEGHGVARMPLDPEAASVAVTLEPEDTAAAPTTDPLVHGEL
jgi:anti-sigma-K factor RskA